MKTWQRIRGNPQSLQKYLIREKVTDIIRKFFKDDGFHEVFTPILVPVPSAESNLEVFKTELRTHTGEKREAFLIMSPEYSLKKLITAGLENIFEITRSFRNEEEVTALHNPEFTMLEWYRVGADYTDIMKDFENLFCTITGSETIIYQGEKYNLTLPWPRISVAEAFAKYTKTDTETMLDPQKLKTLMAEKGYKTNEHTTWEQMFYQIFFNEIEPKLKESRRPVFVYDYPVSQAALARKKPTDSRFAERFEVFLAGMELGNCFSELTNANEQEQRFTADLAERERLGKTKYPMDRDLIQALNTGMPPVAGIAVGVDRLVMLASDAATIAETLFFPAEEMFDLKS